MKAWILAAVLWWNPAEHADVGAYRVYHGATQSGYDRTYETTDTNMVFDALTGTNYFRVSTVSKDRLLESEVSDAVAYTSAVPVSVRVYLEKSDALGTWCEVTNWTEMNNITPGFYRTRLEILK